MGRCSNYDLAKTRLLATRCVGKHDRAATVADGMYLHFVVIVLLPRIGDVKGLLFLQNVRE